MMLYAICDLPALPEWLKLPELEHLTQLDNSQLNSAVKSLGFLIPGEGNQYRPSVPNEYIDRMLVDKDGQEKSASVVPKFLGDKELQWAKSNISTHAKDIRYTFSTPGRSKVGPHCDLSRRYTLLYLLKSGGDNVATVFYKETNQDDLIRPHGYHVNNYDDLTEIGSLVLPTEQWCIINSGILHSVENIKTMRLSLQIAFDVLPNDISFSQIITVD